MSPTAIASPSPAPDFAAVKCRQQNVWASGDFSVVASRIVAEAEHLDARFVEGDAEDLRFPDASFDAVISICGVMFAPDHRRAASELARVCRRGGRIALASWAP